MARITRKQKVYMDERHARKQEIRSGLAGLDAAIARQQAGQPAVIASLDAAIAAQAAQAAADQAGTAAMSLDDQAALAAMSANLDRGRR